MKLKDILPDKPIELVWRILLNNNTSKQLNSRDIFVGVCEWDGKVLISIDGDDYDIEDEIVGYLEMGDHLIYWTKEDE